MSEFNWHKKVADFQIEDIGIDHSQYFQGRGTSWTPWDHVEVGIGENAYEALEDALSQLAMMGYEVDHIDNPFDANEDNTHDLGWAHDPSCPESDDYEADEDEEDEDLECNCDYSEESELWYHVAVWIKEEETDG